MLGSLFGTVGRGSAVGKERAYLATLATQMPIFHSLPSTRARTHDFGTSAASRSGIVSRQIPVVLETGKGWSGTGRPRKSHRREDHGGQYAGRMHCLRLALRPAGEIFREAVDELA